MFGMSFFFFFTLFAENNAYKVTSKKTIYGQAMLKNTIKYFFLIQQYLLYKYAWNLEQSSLKCIYISASDDAKYYPTMIRSENIFKYEFLKVKKKK